MLERLLEGRRVVQGARRLVVINENVGGHFKILQIFQKYLPKLQVRRLSPGGE